jgi:hypothetical protein
MTVSFGYGKQGEYMTRDTKSLIAMLDMHMALAGVNHHLHSNLYPLEMDIHHIGSEAANEMVQLNRLMLGDTIRDPVFICGDRMPSNRDFEIALSLGPNVDFGVGNRILLADEEDQKPQGSSLLLKLVGRI